MIYRTQFVNLVLAGRSIDGEDFALTAGTHGPNYPLCHPAAHYDAVMISAGSFQGQRIAPVIPGMELPSCWPDSDRELAMALDLGGPPSAPPDGEPNRGAFVEACIPLRLGPVIPHFLGFRRWLGWLGSLIPGATYYSCMVESPVRSRPWLHLEGREFALEPLSLVGLLEWVDMTGVDLALFRFGYHYTAALDTAGGNAMIDLSTFGLTAEGTLGKLMDLVFQSSGSLRLEGATRHRNDLELLEPRPVTGPLPLEKREVLVRQALDLGPARLRRSLCRWTHPAGTTWLGLDEEVDESGS